MEKGGTVFCNGREGSWKELVGVRGKLRLWLFISMGTEKKRILVETELLLPPEMARSLCILLWLLSWAHFEGHENRVASSLALE